MTESTSSGVVPVNGADIHYDQAGSGHPLILLHAGICDRRMWDDQVPAFAERYRVIRYDLRGFGQTPMPPGPFSHVADLEGLMNALGVERAHLLGCSKGGTTVLDLALAHPERVGALVMVTSGPSGFKPDEPIPDPPQWAAVLAACEAHDVDLAAELDVQMWVDGPHRTPAQVDAALMARVLEMDKIAVRNEFAGLGQEQKTERPAAPRLSEVRAPTLVVIGDLDALFSVRSGEALVAGIPGARRVVLAGAAHLPNLEQPEAFNRAVLEFLRGV